ncbi:MAG: hypothetical protein ACYC6L_12820 [Anaerolineae bacterium]
MSEKWADLYPILPWDSQHGFKGDATRRHGLKSIADCNFTMSGFVFPQDLPACEQLGLAAIMYNEEQLTASFRWIDRTPDQIDDIIRRWVEKVGDNPAIYGYYIMDEPGAQDFPNLGLAVAALNKYAPGKAAYINLFPNYATMGKPGESQLGTVTYEEHLERFVTEVKPPFISYDSYQVQYSQDAREPDKMESYYTNLLQVRDCALRHNLPWWQIVSPMQIFDNAMPPTPATMLLQAYTTLAAGARSVGWFTYYSYGSEYAAIDQNDNKTWIWYYLAETNRQIKLLGPLMNRLTSTGVYFSGLQQTAPVMEHLPALPGTLVKSLSSEMPLMVGEFVDSTGLPYVMVVNLSPERTAKITAEWQADLGSPQAFSVGDGEFHALTAGKPLWLVPGMGVLLRKGA